MNCNEFEIHITDLARSPLIDVAVRERATAHAAECRRCAARLQDERRLTSGLRELSATFAAAPEVPDLEAKVLAAFRAERAARPTVKRIPSRFRWAVAAAIVAIAVLVVILAVRRAELRHDPPVQADNDSTERQVQPVPEMRELPTMPEAARHGQRRPKIPQRDVTTARLGAKARPEGKKKTDVEPNAAPGGANEIATSFIRLTGDPSLGLADSLQMVRIELPRSALVSFGLPMNIERADERIKADVLVSNDGVAHAIRFVR